MKRFYLILTVLCAVWLVGCNEDIDLDKDLEGNGVDADKVSLLDGGIVINSRPDLTIVQMNKPLERSATGEAGNIVKSNTYIEPYEYNFKQVAEMSTLVVEGVEVQATHVKISEDGFAFVSYNKKDGPRTGGVVVYKYNVQGNTFDDINVGVTIVTSIEMTQAQVNALDFYEGKLYIAGSSTDERLGFDDDKGYNCAFFMVMELNADKTFKPVDPNSIVYLTSFQATSIRVVNGRIYVTSGDGSLGTRGGLHIYDANSYEHINSILDLDNARSVDVDETNIYLMQARPARVTKFNLDGGGTQQVYASTNEAMQKDAKSDIIISEHGYLYVALNESGLKMLSPTYHDEMASRERPGPDPENDVTNSLSMNTDPKRNNAGEYSSHEMLLVANGAKGLYWYDIIWDTGGTFIKETANNSILNGSGSTNYVESKGNIVFVADGLGGLKVLYFEVVEQPETNDDQYITMTTEAETVHVSFEGYGDIIVDWGDGSKYTGVLTGFENYMTVLTHEYNSAAPRTITITGENILNFNCSDNQITELDASNYTGLVSLNCSRNKLTELDVSKNTALTALIINSNLLTDLDVSKNVVLQSLYCSNNQLTELDVSKNVALSILHCDNNQLTELDVSNNPQLWRLHCGNNQLTELDLCNNTVLVYLTCNNNQLTELDVSENIALIGVNCRNNLFTADALNALFGSLHSNSTLAFGGKRINTGFNPGTSTCDPGIAEEKGWSVEE